MLKPTPGRRFIKYALQPFFLFLILILSGPVSTWAKGWQTLKSKHFKVILHSKYSKMGPHIINESERALKQLQGFFF